MSGVKINASHQEEKTPSQCGARIENCTARGARFDGASFRGADLTDTDFSRASLRAVNLEGVTASGANFRGTDFSGATPRQAELVDADLRGADLTGTDLSGADQRGADLRGALGDLLLQDSAAAGTLEGLPSELKSLAGTIAPIVGEVLRTAGRRGVIDAETSSRLVEYADALARGTSPSALPDADTVTAVAEVLDAMGDEVLPELLEALRRPDEEAPSEAVRDMIRRLGRTLGLDDTATAEDLLDRLGHGEGDSAWTAGQADPSGSG